MENQKHVVTIIKQLRSATRGMILPAITRIIREYGRDPFLILISCLLSLRTKDTVSLPASQRLFKYARDPQAMLLLSTAKIEQLVYPVGFYRRKAFLLHTVSREIIDRFHGAVPRAENDLLSIHGVGRKTANLVRGEGFGIPAICVDTHVHRISNRLGIVTTDKPEKTEKALKKLLPKQYWIEYNRLMVMWGQNICVPISPFCSRCAIAPLCQKVGVTVSR